MSETLRDIALELLDKYMEDEEQLDSEFYLGPQEAAQARRKRERYEWLSRIQQADNHNKTKIKE